VSIHVNWIENRKARGVETYFLGATEDPFLTRLAAEENRESGYSMADMRKLLDGIYADVRHEKSHKLAETVQASLFSSLRKINPHLDDRGVKAAPFIVLLSTEMPAVLAEVSCLSNEEEAQLLAKPLYRQYIAEALASGVRSYADAVEGKPETSQISKKGT
jgi:N-acetylmuramoyl-L-alanine amidase